MSPLGLSPTHNSFGLLLNEIEGKISCGGLYRWSPTYLGRDIAGLFEDLSDLNMNTLVRRFPHPTCSGLILAQQTSTSARAVIDDRKLYRGLWSPRPDSLYQ